MHEVHEQGFMATSCTFLALVRVVIGPRRAPRKLATEPFQMNLLSRFYNLKFSKASGRSRNNQILLEQYIVQEHIYTRGTYEY